MIYAMFAMVMLTFLVGIITFKTRVNSVKKGEVSARYYKLMQGDEIPEAVIKTSRNFTNQFEIPVLFYVAASLFAALQIESDIALACAWIFVACRCAHAFIHLTYNHLLHRIIAFWAANFAVLSMWISLVSEI
ncbi:MAPEG family protein [Catenovulum sediminis]|uniref:MAPEG family protein n=1 Tax=Catenovulum sediminis TaxID=1740262 RepID=A0ABV1RHS5_9ALTE|nr:MAPEG family protein [Catenovulum sediminis]